MVSGLVTSPKDQDRIFSGEAREILIALKSFSVVGLLAKASVSNLKLLTHVVCGLPKALGAGRWALVCPQVSRCRLRHAIRHSFSV